MQLSKPIYRLKRQAKHLSRNRNIPLHRALDLTASQEGFSNWSHLSAFARRTDPITTLLKTLSPGELILIGARPGHGKTLLGLELAVEATQLNYQSFFFTLEFSKRDVQLKLKKLKPEIGTLDIIVDDSDDICATYIKSATQCANGRAFIVVDYLQLLDQKRTNPPLEDQIDQLNGFVRSSGAIIVFISQIDRRFEDSSGTMPTSDDIRMPNPINLSVFSSFCFLNQGEIAFSRNPSI